MPSVVDRPAGGQTSQAGGAAGESLPDCPSWFDVVRPGIKQDLLDHHFGHGVLALAEVVVPNPAPPRPRCRSQARSDRQRRATRRSRCRPRSGTRRRACATARRRCRRFARRVRAVPGSRSDRPCRREQRVPRRGWRLLSPSPAHEVPGPDSDRRDCRSVARFIDPDAKGWVLQEVKERGSRASRTARPSTREQRGVRSRGAGRWISGR
jgi:hypothetical protein